MIHIIDVTTSTATVQLLATLLQLQSVAGYPQLSHTMT